MVVSTYQVVFEPFTEPVTPCNTGLPPEWGV